MSECDKCRRLELKVRDLEDEIEIMSNASRLLGIAEEYAELLASEGKIPNTPAGKKSYIRGEIEAR